MSRKQFITWYFFLMVGIFIGVLAIPAPACAYEPYKPYGSQRPPAISVQIVPRVPQHSHDHIWGNEGRFTQYQLQQLRNEMWNQQYLNSPYRSLRDKRRY